MDQQLLDTLKCDIDDLVGRLKDMSTEEQYEQIPRNFNAFVNESGNDWMTLQEKRNNLDILKDQRNTMEVTLSYARKSQTFYSVESYENYKVALENGIILFDENIKKEEDDISVVIRRIQSRYEIFKNETVQTVTTVESQVIPM